MEEKGGREDGREELRKEGKVGRWEGKKGDKEGGIHSPKKDKFLVFVGGAVMVLLTVHSEEGGVIGSGACLVRRRDVAVVVSLV